MSKTFVGSLIICDHDGLVLLLNIPADYSPWVENNIFQYNPISIFGALNRIQFDKVQTYFLILWRERAV